MKRNFKFILVLCISLLIISCDDQKSSEESKNEENIITAESIIDNALKKYGSALIDKNNIHFQFREHTYAYIHDDDNLLRSREKADSIGMIIKDFWEEDSLYRLVNQEIELIDQKTQHLYKNSINSVFYFAFLPKSLTDDAVNPELLGEVTIKEEPYYKIKVTFSEEGGGEDHEDIFLYWFHKDKYTMDYLAYEYFTEGGGIRFREAINPREVSGITFQDYVNYKPKSKDQDFMKIDELFNNGETIEVSRIELKNIKVEPK